MFETYQFSGVYIAIQAVLTLYAQGMLAHHHASPRTFKIQHHAHINPVCPLVCTDTLKHLQTHTQSRGSLGKVLVI